MGRSSLHYLKSRQWLNAWLLLKYSKKSLEVLKWGVNSYKEVILVDAV